MLSDFLSYCNNHEDQILNEAASYDVTVKLGGEAGNTWYMVSVNRDGVHIADDRSLSIKNLDYTLDLIERFVGMNPNNTLSINDEIGERLSTQEKLIAALNKEVEHKQYVIDHADEVIAVVNNWNGKTYSKRFRDAIEKRVDKIKAYHINSTFSWSLDYLEIEYTRGDRYLNLGPRNGGLYLADSAPTLAYIKVEDFTDADKKIEAEHLIENIESWVQRQKDAIEHIKKNIENIEEIKERKERLIKDIGDHNKELNDLFNRYFNCYIRR